MRSPTPCGLAGAVLFVVASALGLSAVEPGGASGLADYDKTISQKDREHWSYLPVRSISPPSVRNKLWLRNPIDAFILQKLEARGWKPQDPALPLALLRRAHLDLIGLPPTLAEQEAFLGSDAPDKWERLIEDLLSRPGYGERWGRHWLDLVRYAESNGYERDATKPYVWRYRDYVIRAFNNDKPYDRFIVEQIAGDELDEVSTETMIATGFHRLGPWDDEPADPKEDRFDQLNDIVSTTSLVFLGMTMGCARCHNHRFDPVTMHDYYRMVAIFNPLQRPQKGRQELTRPAGSLEAVERKKKVEGYLRGLLELRKAQSLILEPFPKYEISGAMYAAWKALRPFIPEGYFLEERSNKAPDTHLLIRGSSARPGPKVEPGFPAVLVKKQPSFPVGRRTTQRRLALARWIASKDNPLTARVIVNRVWQYHFGQGIVRTPSDFGILGHRPSHSALLDWLAQWFVRHGWSIKKLHRLIMTSSTYRMSKAYHSAYAKADPENELFWRFPYKRLEVEAIRDSILSVSGQLHRKMYGPSMYPEVPRQALLGHSDPEKIWKPFREEEASRRTVYAFIKRSFVVPFLEVFDYCDTAQSTERRARTTVAPQALTLFNSSFTQRQARHFARRLRREAGEDPKKQIELAYRLALCRMPLERELEIMLQFLNRESEALLSETVPGRALSPSEARQRAMVQLCRAILNLNELVYPE